LCAKAGELAEEVEGEIIEEILKIKFLIAINAYFSL